MAGARVLDLFAGTGALGSESLSRGARELGIVEKSSRHAQFYRRNLDAIGLPTAGVELRVQDVFPSLHQRAGDGRQFELIVADPPYGDKNVDRRSESFAQRLLDEATLPRLLAPCGTFVLWHTKRDIFREA